MPAVATRDPEVVKLDPGDYIVPLGDGLHNLSSVVICDTDPIANPEAPCYPLVALTNSHYTQLIDQRSEDEIPRARPMYFVHRKGMVNLELYPRCDQPYWLRAVFRKPIKYGNE